MEPRTLIYIAQACAGELISGAPGAVVHGVCTDSRQVQPGDLFIAVRGDRFDGHDFLTDVIARGAAALVVQRHCGTDLVGRAPVIAVDDTRLALGRIGARYRQDFDIPVVAVGGSNGKSSTKELIGSVLAQAGPALWSEASFNNDIGVPLTLLRLASSHRAAVLEVGSNHPGELRPLVGMVRPRLGVITSIGREHLEFFGDLEGVLREEGDLARSLPPDGTLFLNTSSGPVRRLARVGPAAVVTVGWEPDNDWSASFTGQDLTGAVFAVRAPRPEFSGRYRVNLLGRHQVLNALLALAVGAALGVSPEMARRGLEQCRPLKMRLQSTEVGGVRLLDDSYNANADSALAALQTLADLPASGRRIAVLGDMAELGAQAIEAHTEVGRRAACSRLDMLCTVGPLSRLTALAARQDGLEPVREFSGPADAAEFLVNALRPGDLVLVKGSRISGLDQIVSALKTRGTRPDRGLGAMPALAAAVLC